MGFELGATDVIELILTPIAFAFVFFLAKVFWYFIRIVIRSLPNLPAHWPLSDQGRREQHEWITDLTYSERTKDLHDKANSAGRWSVLFGVLLAFGAIAQALFV